jgi:hypothetical protein
MDIQGLFDRHLWNYSLPEASPSRVSRHICIRSLQLTGGNILLCTQEVRNWPINRKCIQTHCLFWKKSKLQRAIMSCSVPLWIIPHWKTQGINQESSWPPRMQVHQGMVPLSWSGCRPHRLWTENQDKSECFRQALLALTPHFQMWPNFPAI